MLPLLHSSLSFSEFFYRLLMILLYIPIMIVLLIILYAMPVVWIQLKGSASSKQVARVKAKVLRVSGWYFLSFLIYLLQSGCSSILNEPGVQ